MVCLGFRVFLLSFQEDKLLRWRECIKRLATQTNPSNSQKRTAPFAKLGILQGSRGAWRAQQGAGGGGADLERERDRIRESVKKSSEK